MENRFVITNESKADTLHVHRMDGDLAEADCVQIPPKLSHYFNLAEGECLHFSTVCREPSEGEKQEAAKAKAADPEPSVSDGDAYEELEPTSEE